METFEILFVDDDRTILNLVEEYLNSEGYNLTCVDSGLGAIELMKHSNFQLVFTDLKMPGLSGIELLRRIKKNRPETEVILITGHGTIESAVKSLKLGCYDFLQKPIKLERLKVLIDRIIEQKKLLDENIILKKRLNERYKYDDLIGATPKMQEIYRIIDRISLSSPTVLIQGESGTGKELLANIIHKNSNRKEKPFIPVNCGAIAEGLLESELFGHVKGSFTGAFKDTIGLFRAADGGAIFLDEITEIRPHLQVKLLRVIQEKKIRPVGDTKEYKINVRLIAASNRDLDEAMMNGILRKDLFYRLNVVSIKMPSLIEIKDDITLLINHFIQKFNSASKKKIEGVSPETLGVLINYHWPGNVRQLENVIERAFALGVGKTITINDLPPEIRKPINNSITDETSYSLKTNEIVLIKKALFKTNGNKTEAAKLLGINLATLYRKIKRYNLTEKPSQIANNYESQFAFIQSS